MLSKNRKSIIINGQSCGILKTFFVANFLINRSIEREFLKKFCSKNQNFVSM
jgi:hypothetical protein